MPIEMTPEKLPPITATKTAPKTTARAVLSAAALPATSTWTSASAAPMPPITATDPAANALLSFMQSPPTGIASAAATTADGAAIGLPPPLSIPVVVRGESSGGLESHSARDASSSGSRCIRGGRAGGYDPLRLHQDDPRHMETKTNARNARKYSSGGGDDTATNSHARIHGVLDSGATHQRQSVVVSSETDAEEDVEAVAATTKKPKKVRKRTYYMRKEEKEVLSKELQELEMRMAYFQEKEELIEQWKRIRQRQHDNRSLRNAIRSQRLVFANTRCMMSQFMQEQDNSPFETYIKLGMDPAQRRTTLLAMKQKELEEAIAFLTERGRYLDHSKSFVDAQRFENSQGDYCSIRFDVTPFEGLQSARQVFDKYLNFSFNLEISISEILGDITIREDDDLNNQGREGLAHHRIVSSISNMVKLDMNSVMFSEFFDQRAAGDLHTSDSTETTSEMGVIVYDFVDEDELYPYLPNDRVRQDVTSLVMITSFKRKKFQNDPKKAPNSFHNHVLLEEDELVVVMMRWTHLKVHRTDFYIPEEIQQRMRSGIEQVADSFITNVRQAVYSSSSRPVS